MDLSSVVDKFSGMCETFSNDVIRSGLKDLGAYSIKFSSTRKFVRSVSSGPNTKVSYLGLIHDALAFWNEPSKIVPLFLLLGPF